MLLNNIRLLNDKKPACLAVSGELISSLHENNSCFDDFRIDFEDAVAFPGLINSHDHLDFNCFPVLGSGNYKSYREWGADIHVSYKKEIDSVLKIPQNLRTAWGVYKNLLAGVTTVINHGSALHIENPLIHIDQNNQNLHSVAFQKRRVLKMNNPFLKNKLCVIHAGEGTDEASYREINKLLKWNPVKRKIIGVHAVAMKADQAKRFHAVVWCPESNRQLLNAHADAAMLAVNTQLLFGTDSTLTGSWNIWDHLRAARETQAVKDEQLFNMVSTTPAKTWKKNTGSLTPGKNADIVIARACSRNFSGDEFFALNPKDILMVISNGNIRLFDEQLIPQLTGSRVDMLKFNPVNMNGHIKFVEGNLPALMAQIKEYYPEAVFPCTSLTPTKPADFVKNC